MAKAIGVCQCEISRLQSDYLSGGVEMVLSIPKEHAHAARQIAQDATGRRLQIKVTEYRKKRSLDQNSYMWGMISELAKVNRTTREEVYIQMVERYGDWYQIAVPPKEAQQVMRLFRNVTDIETVEVNGGKITKFHGYPGSSQYDTEQMTRLIDGVISECKELGIPTDIDHYGEFYAKE